MFGSRKNSKPRFAKCSTVQRAWRGIPATPPGCYRPIYHIAAYPFLQRDSRWAEDKSQDQEQEIHALPGMQDDGKPVTAKSFRGEGIDEPRQNGRGNAPGLVEMIEAKYYAIGDPIPSSEHAFHFG